MQSFSTRLSHLLESHKNEYRLVLLPLSSCRTIVCSSGLILRQAATHDGHDATQHSIAGSGHFLPGRAEVVRHLPQFVRAGSAIESRVYAGLTDSRSDSLLTAGIPPEQPVQSIECNLFMLAYLRPHNITLYLSPNPLLLSSQNGDKKKALIPNFKSDPVPHTVRHQANFSRFSSEDSKLNYSPVSDVFAIVSFIKWTSQSQSLPCSSAYPAHVKIIHPTLIALQLRTNVSGHFVDHHKTGWSKPC